VREWENAETQPLLMAALGERYRRYRLADPRAEEAMAWSLQRLAVAAPAADRAQLEEWTQQTGSCCDPFRGRLWCAMTTGGIAALNRRLL
jgi:hypothetical protein